MFDSHYPDTFVALKKDDNENDEEPTRSDTILFLRNRNNSCANWIDSGNYNQAIVTLGATVNLLNRTITAEKDSVPGATNNRYSLDDCLDYSAALRYPIKEFELRFHQRALRIPQKDIPTTTVLLSILTFNLALANHHKAVQRAGPSRTQQTLAKLETSVLLIKRTVRLYQLLLPTDGDGSTTSSTTSHGSGSQRFTRMVEQNITHIKTYLIQQKQERHETIMEQQKSADARPTTSTTRSVTTDKTTTTTSTTSTKVKYASMMLQQFIKKNESADRKMVVTSTCSRQRNDEDDDTDTESVPSSSSLYEEHKALLRARYSSSMDPATTAPSFAADDTTAHGGFRKKFHTAMCTASAFGHLQQQQQQHHPTPQTKNVQGAYAA